MKILITGGGGFIGRNLARLLPQFGHEVYAPTRQELDMCEYGEYRQFLDTHEVDAIVHTAFRGHFSAANTENDLLNNLKMYENLTLCDGNRRPTIIFGSGSEFDRRLPINNAMEAELFDSWPMDLYGLSKNIISRRFMNLSRRPTLEIENPFLLRLFGCFGVDEPEFRFIRRSITRLKEGLPIEIEQDKFMDFFYIEDVANVVDRVIKVQSTDTRHMNLVYPEKRSLSEIAHTICNIMNLPARIDVKNMSMDKPYTGDGQILARQEIPFFGLDDGIRYMVEQLSK